MFNIQCDNCGEDLEIDDMATMDFYMQDADYLLDDKGNIVEKSIQQYLIYSCRFCDKKYKFTYKDWEKRYRERVAIDVMEVRKQKMFANMNPESVNPDNGLEWCGQCSGYAGDGNCLVDIIKQCTIRDEK